MVPFRATEVLVTIITIRGVARIAGVDLSTVTPAGSGTVWKRHSKRVRGDPGGRGHPDDVVSLRGRLAHLTSGRRGTRITISPPSAPV